VRSQLENFVQCCHLYLRKDVLAIETVQGRIASLIPDMAGSSYEETIICLGIYSVEFIRVRGDSIETNNILTR